VIFGVGEAGRLIFGVTHLWSQFYVKVLPNVRIRTQQASSRRAQEYDRICYVAFSRRIADSQTGEEAVADEVSAVWRMVRRRSMPTVWSTPDERGDWLPSVRGNARPGELAKVAAGRCV